MTKRKNVRSLDEIADGAIGGWCATGQSPEGASPSHLRLPLPCQWEGKDLLIVDISRLAKHDDLGHDQFVSVAVLSRLHDQAARYRNRAGTFIFADDDETFLRPIDIGNQVAAQ